MHLRIALLECLTTWQLAPLESAMKGDHKSFNDLVLEVTHPSFDDVLLEVSSCVQPTFKGKAIRLYFLR
jgi:hypothetical protein